MATAIIEITITPIATGPGRPGMVDRLMTALVPGQSADCETVVPVDPREAGRRRDQATIDHWLQGLTG